MSSQTITLQRLEGAVITVASVWLYQMGHGSFWLLALLLFAPDISMLGYLKSSRVGALIYNLGHSYFLPGLIALGFLTATHNVPAVLYIWFMHIGMDRLLGYGLKENTGFRHTHLGVIGKN